MSTKSFAEIVAADKPLEFEVARNCPLLVSEDGKRANNMFDDNSGTLVSLDYLMRKGKKKRGYIKKADRLNQREIAISYSNKTHEPIGDNKERQAILDKMAENADNEIDVFTGIDVNLKGIYRKQQQFYNLLDRLGWFVEDEGEDDEDDWTL